MTHEERERLLRLQSHEMHEAVADNKNDERANALIEVIKADRHVSDCYYAWLGVSEGNDENTPEHRAWNEAMLNLARVASAYIDHYVHHHCLSPHLRPKNFQDDDMVQRARQIMGGA